MNSKGHRRERIHRRQLVGLVDEGGATLENSKTRFIAPALSLLAPCRYRAPHAEMGDVLVCLLCLQGGGTNHVKRKLARLVDGGGNSWH